jgi:hypothetical protein
LWAAWLHRKQNVHDVALMNGTGPRLHNPRRQTFWGHEQPKSWFDEPSALEDVTSGDLRPIRGATLPDRPFFRDVGWTRSLL